jgi:hypothetical protein
MNRGIHVVLALLVAHATGEDSWRATTWDNGPAWSAEVGDATAIVSVTRGRLIWFGPHGGDNLLYVPEGGSLNVAGAVLHGGHHCWLGPQSRWQWPPPLAWESGAVSAERDGALLTLHMPDGIGVPSLTRTYLIEDRTLRCGLRWSDSERPWHAMQVLQVPRAMRLDPVVVRPAEDLPRGCLFDVEGQGDTLPLACTIIAHHLTLVPATLGAKVFLPPQPLRGVLGAWALTMLPGTVHGRAAGIADRGLTTQVYLGQPVHPYIELEQCGDLLLPDADGFASVEMILQITTHDQ